MTNWKEELVKVKRSLIKIGDRFRKDYGDIAELAESIKKHGQIVPLIVDDEYNLIDGGRRSAALELLQAEEAEIIFRKDVDELTARELELETTLARKDLTDVEKADAIAEIHRLKVAKYGGVSTGKGSDGTGGWSHEDTAKSLSIGRATVSTYLKVAEAKAKSAAVAETLEREGITAAYKMMLYEAEQAAVKEMANAIQIETEALDDEGQPEFDQTAPERAKKILWKGDCLRLIKEIPDGSIDLIHTDSPYGIDIQKLHSKAGGFSADLYKEDSAANYVNLVTQLAPEYFRVLKPNGWLFWWLHFEAQDFCIKEFTKAGFSYQNPPFVWVKVGGRYPCYDPAHKFASGVDLALLFMKGQPVFLRQGRPNFSLCASLEDTEKVHSLERPPDLVKDIISTLAHPGHIVLDTFAGGGSTAKACIDLGIDSINMELEERYYNALFLQLVEKLGGPPAPVSTLHPILNEFPEIADLGYSVAQIRRLSKTSMARILKEKIPADQVFSILPDGDLITMEDHESLSDTDKDGDEDANSSQ